MCTTASALLAILFALPFAAVSAQEQTEASNRDGVIGLEYLAFSVADLERSLRFYRDTLGLTVIRDIVPPRAVRPDILDAPGTTYRLAILQIPGSTIRVRLLEFSDALPERRAAKPGTPGSVALLLTVSGLNDWRDRWQSTTPTSTHSLLPGLAAGDGQAALLVSDPDGFTIELVDTDPDRDRYAVIGAEIALAVLDLDASIRFYNRALNFDFVWDPPPRATGAAEEQSLTARQTGVRYTRSMIPGTDVPLSLQLFPETTALASNGRIRDSGVAALMLTVAALKQTLRMVDGSGGSVRSGPDGSSNPIPPHPRRTWVRDPNGFLILLSSPRSVL